MAENIDYDGDRDMLNWLWVRNREEYDVLIDRLTPIADAVDSYIAVRESLEGYCGCCGQMQIFTVSGGARFGDRPNLREGLICHGCGLTNRQRLLLGAIRDHWRGDAQLSLLERFSPLYDFVARQYPNVISSEFLQGDNAPGAIVDVSGVSVRHEDATALSMPANSLDGIIHNDILEHVPNYPAVFAESFRVLKKRGTTVFCCPFFPLRDEHLIRARHLPDETIEHLEPPELHGDPLGEGGILAYYHFGWRLLDEMRAAGFKRVELGILYEPFAGFTSSFHPERYGNMFPSVLRGFK